MKQDEMMESQIVSEVNARREPARMIARRQKEMKESKKATTETDDMTEDEEKKVMNSEDREDLENEASESQLDDVKDELDNVVQSWRERARWFVQISTRISGKPLFWKRGTR